ncbi:MAG: YdbH domain-containing protein [Pseudomonadota bacterium]
MRAVLRGIFVFLLLIVLLVSTLYIFRTSLVEAVIEGRVNGQTDGKLSLEINELSSKRLSVGQLIYTPLDGDQSTLSGIDIDYTIAGLLNGAIVDAVSISGGQILVEIDGENNLSIAGLSLPQGKNKDTSRTNASLPKITLGPTEVFVKSPLGSGRILGEGRFDEQTGGHFDIDISSDALKFGGMALREFQGDARLNFEAKGQASLTGKSRATVITRGLSLRDFAISFDAIVDDWRQGLSNPSESEIQLSLKPENFTLFVDEGNAEAGILNLPLQTENPSFDVKTEGAIKIQGGALQPSLYFDPYLKFQIVDGGSLSFSSLDGAVITSDENGPVVGVKLELDRSINDLSSKKALFQIRARQNVQQSWLIETLGDISAQKILGLSLRKTLFALKGGFEKDTFTGTIDIQSGIQSARLGRMVFSDSRLVFDAPLSLSLADKTLSIGASCLNLERGAFTLAAQNMDGSLQNGTLCSRDGNLAEIVFSRSSLLSVRGVLAAERGRYRFGETRITGLPPNIELNLTYAPENHATRLKATYSGGSVSVNGIVNFSGAEGTFNASLDGPVLEVDIDLSRSRISLVGTKPLANPVVAKATARLRENRFDFSGDFRSLKGLQLGKANGTHSVETARGSIKIDTDRLVFEPGGLQPEDLTPLLRGLVSEATGEANSVLDLSWGANGLSSSGTFALDNVSFRGPGLAVSRTSGVTGSVRFSSLAPIKTDGEQTIAISGVDLDALLLENGELRFTLPGDNTILISKGTFPWFGGTIGAYETVTPLTGEKIETRLQAEGVNLNELFDYLAIDGLSGEGVVQGVLPIIIEDGKARIEDGVLSAVGPGILRYTGKTASAAAKSKKQAELAFNILRDLRYDLLEARINGPLDGNIDFAVRFEGLSNIPLDGSPKPVNTPVIYRLNINAPILELIRQGRVSTDVNMQYQELRRALGVTNDSENANGIESRKDELLQDNVDSP